MSETGNEAGRAWLSMTVVAALVVGADQLSKAAIRSALSPGETRDLVLGVDLGHVTNDGIAFGLLDGAADAVVLAVTAGALILVSVWFAFAAAKPLVWLGAGLLVGGAIGNLVDRLRLDAVTDFIDPSFWPAFNLADVAITVGVVVLALVAIADGGDQARGPHVDAT